MGIGQVFSNPASLKLSEDYRKEAYSSDVKYESLYLTGLRNSDYNIQLDDYSYFQFSASGEKVRLSYFPNPFFGADSKVMQEVGEKHEYLLEGLLDVETFLQEIADARAAHIPPLLRYEFDKKGYKELIHPTSHFHVGYHSSNRWPVQRKLTPESFGLFVLKLYYSEYWTNSGPLAFGPGTESLDNILAAAKAKCPITEANYFKESEKRLFFIG